MSDAYKFPYPGAIDADGHYQRGLPGQVLRGYDA
jgi:hypothetical protein